jgi:hypothetical protein
VIVRCNCESNNKSGISRIYNGDRQQPTRAFTKAAATCYMPMLLTAAWLAGRA